MQQNLRKYDKTKSEVVFFLFEEIKFFSFPAVVPDLKIQNSERRDKYMGKG